MIYPLDYFRFITNILQNTFHLCCNSFHLQILILIFNKVKWIKQLLFPLKPSENHEFFNDFMKKRMYLINLKFLNIRTKSWWQSLKQHFMVGIITHH